MSPSRLSTYPWTGYYNECNWVTFGRYLSNIWYSHLYKILFVVFSGKNHTQTKRALRDEQLQGIMPKTSGQGWFYDIWLKCKVGSQKAVQLKLDRTVIDIKKFLVTKCWFQCANFSHLKGAWKFFIRFSFHTTLFFFHQSLLGN